MQSFVILLITQTTIFLFTMIFFEEYTDGHVLHPNDIFRNIAELLVLIFVKYWSHCIFPDGDHPSIMLFDAHYWEYKIAAVSLRTHYANSQWSSRA